MTQPDLLPGHRAALADGIPDEDPAVATHAGDAAYEGPAKGVDLEPALRQDIAPAPRLASVAQHSVRPVESRAMQSATDVPREEARKIGAFTARRSGERWVSGSPLGQRRLA